MSLLPDDDDTKLLAHFVYLRVWRGRHCVDSGGLEVIFPSDMKPKRKPKRIQRKRVKGWRMPAGAVYVGRPTKWGNPFKVGASVRRDSPLFPYINGFQGLHRIHWSFGELAIVDPETVVEAYERWLIENPPLFLNLHELRSKDLACWCRLDAPCHADILLELANR